MHYDPCQRTFDCKPTLTDSETPRKAISPIGGGIMGKVQKTNYRC